MATGFPVEIKIQTKNFNIGIFIYLDVEKKKLDTNILIFICLIQNTKKILFMVC